MLKKNTAVFLEKSGVDWSRRIQISKGEIIKKERKKLTGNGKGKGGWFFVYVGEMEPMCHWAITLSWVWK